MDVLSSVYCKSLTISVKIGFFKIFGKKIISQKLQNIGALNFDHLFHIYNGQIDQILEALASVLSENFFFQKPCIFATT